MGVVISANRTAIWLAFAALGSLPVAVLAEGARGDPDLMVSRSCKKPEPCSQTWSLTSRLGDILEHYEKRIGRRNRAHRILGIEFTTNERPRIWYPDFGNGKQSVIVQLTRRARRERSLALFQLGHEAFHLMEPLPGAKASFLEEGLASYFALAYLKKGGVRNGLAFVAEKNYREAYDLVAQVAALHDDDFDARLKRLRAMQPSFSRATEDQLRTAFPKTPANVVRQLVSPFPQADVAGNKR